MIYEGLCRQLELDMVEFMLSEKLSLRLD